MRNLRAREENQTGKQEPYVSIGETLKNLYIFLRAFTDFGQVNNLEIRFLGSRSKTRLKAGKIHWEGSIRIQLRHDRSLN